MYSASPIFSVLRSAMGEVTDSTNQARAFSFLPLTWAIGSSLACVRSLQTFAHLIKVDINFSPLMGGFLNHPVERFPKRFRNSQFLKDHPYALPCFASSVISLVIFIVVALFLREVRYISLSNRVHPNTILNTPPDFLLQK